MQTICSEQNKNTFAGIKDVLFKSQFQMTIKCFGVSRGVCVSLQLSHEYWHIQTSPVVPIKSALYCLHYTVCVCVCEPGFLIIGPDFLHHTLLDKEPSSVCNLYIVCVFFGGLYWPLPGHSPLAICTSVALFSLGHISDAGCKEKWNREKDPVPKVNRVKSSLIGWQLIPRRPLSSVVSIAQLYPFLPAFPAISSYSTFGVFPSL